MVQTSSTLGKGMLKTTKNSDMLLWIVISVLVSKSIQFENNTDHEIVAKYLQFPMNYSKATVPPQNNVYLFFKGINIVEIDLRSQAIVLTFQY